MDITVDILVNADLPTAWSAWNNPDDICRWNAASDDWHTVSASVDLREGGSFSSRMEAKDGSFGFDFSGTYTRVVEHDRIEYVLEDGRKVQIRFEAADGGVRVTETFEAEDVNDAELQRAGWQAILDNFARYVSASEPA